MTSFPKDDTVKVAFKSFVSFKRLQSAGKMKGDLVGAKAILDRVATVNGRLAAAALQADLDLAVLSSLTEDKNQKLKKSAFEESKKLSMLFDAFRSISKNIVNPEPKAEDFDSQNLFSKVKELVEKSKSPSSTNIKPRTSSTSKNDQGKNENITQLKPTGSFLPAVSEFVVELEHQQSLPKRKGSGQSQFRMADNIRDESLFDSINQEETKKFDGASPLLDFYETFELGTQL